MGNEIKEQSFIPQVGMKPLTGSGHGYKGTIEHVGKDYFILRSERSQEPVLIKEGQYHNFFDYYLPS